MVKLAVGAKSIKKKANLLNEVRFSNKREKKPYKLSKWTKLTAEI